MLEPIVIMGGFLSQPSDYLNWKTILSRPPYNRRVFIADIGRVAWALTRDDNFKPQLDALQAAVERARRATGADRVWIVAHSAGGRVARLWLGEKPYAGVKWDGQRYTAGLISLGSPYLTKEPWAVKSAAFVNQNYPGAFYEHITYVAAIGKSVFGRSNGSIEERFAFNSYGIQVPGKGSQWGDGVITVEGAQIPGAENHVFEGIYHTGLFGRPSYDANRALKVWAGKLVEEKKSE